MKRKTKILLIIAIPAVAVIAVLIAIYCCVLINDAGTNIRLHSDLSELNAGIREELRMYFEREGHYPENLDVLIPTVLKNHHMASEPYQPKEKDLEMLSHFKYSSDGITYTIIWSFKNYTHKEYGRNGIREKTELYINGQRRYVSHPGEEPSRKNSGQLRKTSE